MTRVDVEIGKNFIQIKDGDDIIRVSKTYASDFKIEGQHQWNRNLDTIISGHMAPVSGQFSMEGIRNIKISLNGDLMIDRRVEENTMICGGFASCFYATPSCIGGWTIPGTITNVQG